MTDRAQALTLEAFLASLVLLGTLLFALGSVGLTAGGAGTADEQVENQLSGVAEGTLDAAAENGSLRGTALYWNPTGDRVHGAEQEPYYVSRLPPTRLGRTLERTFADRDVGVNVNVRYATADGGVAERRLVRFGTPSDDAVRAVRRVTLYDDDRLRDPAGEPTNTTVAETSGFYAPDAAPDGPLYNVVRLEVVVWRL